MSKPERTSVLGACLAVGRHGKAGSDPVQIRELIRDTVEVTARPTGQTSALMAARTTLQLDLPAMGQCLESGPYLSCGFGPAVWSVIARAGAPDTLRRRLAVAFGDTASVVDTGHGLVFLTMSGVHARHVLAKGCRLDLHPGVFKPGHAARTIIAQIPCAIWRHHENWTFGLALPVTFAHSFAHFILAASSENGCEILPLSED
ncbi:MAG: hypothetical protein HEQ16_13595 [Bosea sp.]|nr:hypothetical protein [Bosea sp. (in: a-proteobacteria)]